MGYGAASSHQRTSHHICVIMSDFLQWLSMIKNTLNSMLLLEPVISHTLDDSQIRNQHIAFAKPFIARIDAASEFLICLLQASGAPLWFDRACR